MISLGVLSPTAAPRPTPTSRHRGSNPTQPPYVDLALPSTCRKLQAARGRGLGLAARAGGPSDVFALDLDGVIVNSEPEVSRNGVLAGQAIWPDVFEGIDQQRRRDEILAALRECRPRLVQGFDAMVMARLLVEDLDQKAHILSNWEDLKQRSLDRWGCSATELNAAFKKKRAEQMEADPKAWLKGSKPYKGMIDALRHCPNPVYFVSSKSDHLVSLILRENLGLDIENDSPRVFAGLLPPNEAKAAALSDIFSRPVCQTPGAKLHFIDDRFETLQAISEQQGGDGPWKLYLAAWGYNTEDERAAARAGGITLLDLDQCCELLKWGVVMGVDDGCEPEEDEIVR